MVGWASLKKHWHWPGLVLVSALIAATALIAPSKISMLELEREALTAATRIRAQALAEPEYLFDAFARPALAPRLSQIFDHAGYAHRVLRYELYDEQGELAFTSGRSGLNLGDEAGDAPVKDRAGVRLIETKDTSGPSQVAVLTLPISLSGQPRGTFVVYLDQTDNAQVLFDYFGLIAAITVLSLIHI